MTGSRHKIDIVRAREIRTQCGSWQEAAERYNEEHGTDVRTMTLYHAVWDVDGRKGRKPAEGDRGIRELYRPPLPRPLRVIPDYKTNTVQRATAAGRPRV